MSTIFLFYPVEFQSVVKHASKMADQQRSRLDRPIKTLIDAVVTSARCEHQKKLKPIYEINQFKVNRSKHPVDRPIKTLIAAVVTSARCEHQKKLKPIQEINRFRLNRNKHPVRVSLKTLRKDSKYWISVFTKTIQHQCIFT